MDSSGPEYGLVAASCKHSNEYSVIIKGGEFLDKLSNCHFLKEDSFLLCSLHI
jgi:hypothetical protein